MQHVFASDNSFAPASIPFEIGSKEGQPIPRVHAGHFEHPAHVRLAIEASHSRSDLVARSQQLSDAIAADKPGPASYENRAHTSLFGFDLTSRLDAEPDLFHARPLSCPTSFMPDLFHARPLSCHLFMPDLFHKGGLDGKFLFHVKPK